jgi:hypothetical protein
MLHPGRTKARVHLPKRTDDASPCFGRLGPMATPMKPSLGFQPRPPWEMPLGYSMRFASPMCACWDLFRNPGISVERADDEKERLSLPLLAWQTVIKLHKQQHD